MKTKKYRNHYFILRHGEAFSNKKEVCSCWPERFHNPLSKKGKEEVKKAGERLFKILKGRKIDLIFASDILRTKQTAKIISEKINVKPKYDKRLREFNVGDYNAQPIKEIRKILPNTFDRFKKKLPGGETYSEIKKRIESFLKEIEKKYSHKNILIISHQVPLAFIEGIIKGMSDKEIFDSFLANCDSRMRTAEIRELI